MDTVNAMPRPTDPIAMQRLVDAQQLLNGRIVGEEECEQAIEILEGLAAPKDDDGWDYFPAFLTLGSLYAAGFEPAIEQNPSKAVQYILKFLLDDRSTTIDPSILQDATMQLGGLVKDADLTTQDWEMLESVSRGNGAGQVSSVAAWAKFASMERMKKDERQQESAEKQQRRLEQEARKQAMLVEMKKIFEDTIPRVEEARRQGNDAYRSGNLPGNADYRRYMIQAAEKYQLAADMISTCLPKIPLLEQEVIEMKNQRGLLHSNAAQVQIVLENWEQAKGHAQSALADDPDNNKAHYRLAKSLVELKDWEAAAKATDEALVKIGTAESVAMQRYDLWALAEIIHPKVPTWKWTLAQPKVRDAKEYQDYEKRIQGKWKYHGGEYTIKMEPWGALVFHEQDIKVDMIQKSMLSWSGEFELISGMKINLKYEPGADQIETEMIPPEELAESEKNGPMGQYQGPMKFWATRVEGTELEDAKKEEEQVPEETPKEPPRKVMPVSEQPKAPSAPPLPEIIAPKELWLSGHTGKHAQINGKYLLLEGELQNSRPVYRKDCEADLFLWYRGGSWGVTESLNNSSLSAPFLSRCSDLNGRALHPLEVKRPLFHVRAGRSKEEPDKLVVISATDLSNDEQGMAADGTIKDSSTSNAPMANGNQVNSEPPPVVVLSGRTGKSGSELNGRYELSSQEMNGRPVYDHECEQLRMYYANGGHWAIGPRNFESSRPPPALARCRSDAAHPLRVSAWWDFLSRDEGMGHMVRMDERIYTIDRFVRVTDPDSVPSEIAGAHIPPAGGSGAGGYPASKSLLAQDGDLPSQTTNVVPSPDEVKESSKGATPEARNDSPTHRESPSWVLHSSAEIEGDKVKAQVTVKDGIEGTELSLDVASSMLRIAHGKAVLEIALPVPVDSTAVPAAKWSKKTRTLTTRLEIQRG